MSFRPFCRPVFLPILFVIFRAAALAQAARVDDLLNQLSTVKNYSDVALSSNGHSLAWTESLPDSKTNELHVLESVGSGAINPSKQISLPGAASAKYHDLVWSADGTKLAFLASSGSSQDQIYTLALSSGTVQALTTFKGFAAHLAWVHGGRQLSFLFAENGGGEGPLAAEPEAVGEIGSESHNQRLTLLSEDGGALQQVSPADLNIYEYDWAPDGKSAVAIAAPGPADNNWWIAKLYKLEVGSSRTMSLLYQPSIQQQIAVPRWSPDGKQIAFVGGIMSDQGFVGGDVYTLSVSGGATPHNITTNARYSVASIRWKDSHTLLLSAAVGGGGTVLSINADGKNEHVLWKGSHTVHEAGNYPNLSVALDGANAAMVKSSWSEAPEVWAGTWDNLHPVTNGNASQKPNWGKAESVEWTNGSFHVQGWLLYPENYKPTERYPMIVSVHGGPAGSHTAGWPSPHFDMSVMAGLGYFVFFPNPRGSYGQGEAFTKANVKDFGGGDLQDILAGVDQVLKTVPVDANRIGVTGWSYGGYMTMWTVTQTQRFRAAVAGAGIANWLSYYGENSIDEWMIPYFGASVYDDRAVYAKSSPITFIKQVKTPTLVIVGERDGECPSPQSFEFWHALKSLDVPSKLVVYPGEGHAFRDAEHNRDRMRRTVAWFDQYLRTGSNQQAVASPSGQ